MIYKHIIYTYRNKKYFSGVMCGESGVMCSESGVCVICVSDSKNEISGLYV